MRLGLQLFDPRGRRSRRSYARLFVGATLAGSLLLWLAMAAGAQGWRAPAVLLALGAALCELAIVVQAVARLHDRNRSGWWIAAYLALYGASFATDDGTAEPTLPALAAAIAALTFLAWLARELFGRPGTPGPNRYGPPPG
ncbi:DUF805 domain-containing protein [Methylobacterium sp. A54F]